MLSNFVYESVAEAVAVNVVTRVIVGGASYLFADLTGKPNAELGILVRAAERRHLQRRTSRRRGDADAGIQRERGGQVEGKCWRIGGRVRHRRCRWRHDRREDFRPEIGRRAVPNPDADDVGNAGDANACRNAVDLNAVNTQPVGRDWNKRGNVCARQTCRGGRPACGASGLCGERQRLGIRRLCKNRGRGYSHGVNPPKLVARYMLLAAGDTEPPPMVIPFHELPIRTYSS